MEAVYGEPQPAGGRLQPVSFLFCLLCQGARQQQAAETAYLPTTNPWSYTRYLIPRLYPLGSLPGVTRGTQPMQAGPYILASHEGGLVVGSHQQGLQRHNLRILNHSGTPGGLPIQAILLTQQVPPIIVALHRLRPQLIHI